jgi:CBS domain-containing protein
MVLETVGPPLLQGTVGSVLGIKGTKVYSVEPTTLVYDAIARMDEWRVGALLVMQGEKLVGIISERDYTRRVILRGRASRDTPVADIMTRDVITVGRDTSLVECLGIVTKHGIRHLPVVEDGRVVGLVSIGDLVRAVLTQQAEQISSLKSYIQSDYPT